MDSDKVLQYCDEIDALVQNIRDEVTSTGPEPPEPPTDETLVHAGDDLQTALDGGGALVLEQGAAFTRDGTYRVHVPGTSLRGEGLNLVETTHDHAFDVPIDVDDLAFADFAFAGAANEAFQLGVNGTSQNTVEHAPRGIVFARLRSVGHRGKRAFDVNAADVRFTDCEVVDCYSPDAVDSQAICVLNAPGPVLIEGGHYEAASENVMVGGDSMKIADCRPTGITIRDATFTKPLAWKTAGTPKVKNLVELKDGHDVLIQRCTLTNSWKSAQDGYGFMFTPKNGGSLRNVRVEDCEMSDVGGIVCITGHDFTAADPASMPRTQIEMHGGHYTASKATMGGSGRFTTITEGPERLIFHGLHVRIDGSTFIEYGDKDPCDVLHVTNCDWNYGSYGIRIGGLNHGDNGFGIIRELRIEGCTIHGAHSSFRSRWPNNTYVDVMSKQREREVDQRAAVEHYERELRDELQRMRTW